MADSLYSDDILALAAGLEKNDRLENPDATATVTSPLCGSRVKVDVSVEDGVVTGYGQEVRACALGQSSAALMKQAAIGRTLDEVREGGRQLRAMLKEQGDPPTGVWAGYAALQPARDHRSRHASILLPFDALEKAMASAMAKETEDREHA